MCGLAGFWHLDGRPAEAAIVDRMLDRQKSRGPDDRGTWSSGSVALGLDRLSIMDLSEHGHQPFITPNGSSALVFNGEVYNWLELRGELVSEGVEFTSQCDTEVVLHALDRWGPDKAIPRFNGMFALAWYDCDLQELHLSRDRTGIKPLYVADSPGVLAFASEAKSLFAHPAVACEPDKHSLVTNIYLQRLAGDWTAFEGVRCVLPGTTVKYTPADSITTTWFDVERDVDVDRILASQTEPFDRHVSQFRDMIEQSVEPVYLLSAVLFHRRGPA